MSEQHEPSSPADPTSQTRSIELEVEVVGTPEQVWQAIATGPGISSWYVPHTVEEREGGAATASFGPGPEMQISGRVAAWDPPHRIMFDKGDGAGGLAFEWLVEARDGGSCVVRLVNSGFGTGQPWDDQYDQMTEGWRVFLRNLQLHLEHFAGRQATAALPMAVWPGDRFSVWPQLLRELNLPAEPVVGQHLTIATDDVPRLAGTVVEAAPGKLVLLLDAPAPGTGFLLAETFGQASGVSIWSYLYGPDGAAAAERDEPAWRAWLDARAVPAQG